MPILNFRGSLMIHCADELFLQRSIAEESIPTDLFRRLDDNQNRKSGAAVDNLLAMPRHATGS
ncbi:hypothetical protein DTW90_12740 [Neorhizobium sp. P12A]|uniref:hypothetical protein n=1 Tax=Rhizobium/Agrobacterium group TaxID=227290 RepID=UPI0010529F55|nr:MULTISPECIES: hypothetical protein [Rhizobium/Agrobacterium group]KAA0698648.1 hypothetical protein DTW90_12740 [Neorhizobium sp. P12A]